MKIRKQTYSLDQYLKLMRNETIRSDADVQRLSGQWNSNMTSELISTVLSDGYIPPLILGEETVNKITKLWIIDGLQRSTTLSLFRYGNTRIAKNIYEYMITFQRKVLDENGNPKRDEYGELLWETASFDIRNKTYKQLPEELQDRFCEYQLETAIHQGCDMTEISKHVRRYNNHTAMNTNQKAFTYIDNFAADIRRITENRFFLDVYSGSPKAKINGLLERIVADSILLCDYPNEYQSETKKNFEWLNENSVILDYENLDKLLTRLTDILENTEELKTLFDIKHSHIFTAVFRKFTESERKDSEFGDFLQWFISKGSQTTINERTWQNLNDRTVFRSTRDKSIVLEKLDYLEKLMDLYFRDIQRAA